MTGLFVWHDLMTPDPEAARAFYGELLGWTFEQQRLDDQVSPYVRVHDGHAQCGGIVEMGAEHGAPPHWMPYLSVEDCDAACARVEELGGSVAFGPQDIPEVGRFAVVGDDQGAYVTIIALRDPPAEPSAETRLGVFSWYTLSVQDLDKAARFYGGLLGWERSSIDLGGGATQDVMAREGRPVAGLRPLDDEEAAPAWGVAVMTEQLDEALQRVQELGGSVNSEPQAMGTMGSAAEVVDPTGAPFTLYARA